MSKKRTVGATATARSDNDAKVEVVRLRRLLSDLTALSTLPILWIDRDPPRILDSLLDTLIRTLRLDVAYVHVERSALPALEAAAPKALGPADRVRQALGLAADGRGLTARTAELSGTQPAHLADVRFQAPGIAGLVVVGATRGGFPTEHDQFLLRTATNQGAMALRQAELVAQLRLADQQKNDFIARLGHELRNPLGPILNGAELLDRPTTQDPAAARRAVGLIHRQATHMSRMIDDLLDLARVAHGSVGLRLERVDFAALLMSAVEDRRPLAEKAGLRLTAALPEAPVWIHADPVRVSQIVANLLVNAEKFTARGGSVTVVLHQDDSSGESVVDISDTGIGLDPERIETLFEPFTQARPYAPRGQPGLGLGLPLARGLARLHGGDLTASSGGPGQGAAFTLRLPIASEGLQVEDAPSSPASRPRRVLLVEDNQDVAESMELLIESLGHEVRVARTGEQALAMARTDPPEVVICDIGLPEPLDGLALARKLRADAATATIHLIALTGYGTEGDRRRSQEAGFNLHLTKPVAISTLEEVLSTAGLVD